MPLLDWIGKNKIVNHHLDVPYHLLKHKFTFDGAGVNNEKISENKIIHGDNLLALKSLLPEYEGKIKCIYIDPPYNTGNEEWIYNDNVNDPRIKKWLGEVVGKEGEDLSRHDKWLSMMYPRLKLIQKLLKDDGALVISISHHELNSLISICKEIFATKQIVTVTVQTSGGKPSGGFTYVHEYLIFIVPKDFKANSIDLWGGKNRSPFEGLTLSTFDKTQRPNQTYPIFVDKETGNFVDVGKSLQELIDEGLYTGEKSDFVYDYSIAPEGTVAIYPVTANGKECVWRQISQRFKSDWEKGYIKISPNKSAKSLNEFSIQYLPSGVIKKIQSGELEVIGTEDNAPTLKFGANQTVGGQIPTMWTEKAFHTVNGTKMLKAIFPEAAKVFDYPKPVDLITSIIEATTSENDIILDSFAGSGTTAHGVLNLNFHKGGNRKFILIEMMDYAESITANRVKRVITGFGENDQYIEGTQGDFSYYELGEKLLIDGVLNRDIAINKIREYIYFAETKSKALEICEDEPNYLGSHFGTGYYLFYEKDKEITLNRQLLSQIKTRADKYVIYADLCTLSDNELEKYNITFKKLSRDIATF